jgi:predicted outer membrane repeat protein
MTRTNVMRNVGRSGGGLAISGSLEITDGIISGNTCQYDGGGISLGWGNASFLNRVTINDNQAGVNGGGIANQGSVVTLTNVTISGNSATTGDGGAIYNYAQTGHLSSVKLSSSTVAYNSAPFGARGGLMGWQDVNGQNTIIIFSSIFAYNSGDNCFIDEGTIESWGYNVFDDENCSPVPSADLVNTDPKLSPLAWNSGYVQTHALQPGSPAVGHNKLACEEVDARGVPRRTPCDSGSFEQTKWVFIPLILNQ